jgi:hypothetical protein
MLFFFHFISAGDITSFTLPSPYGTTTFDFVMLNDVMEHIQKNRYGCFFAQLARRTHVGSVVYMHTPTPAAQLRDQGQFYENVLPHHYVVMGMAKVGFELLAMELDIETVCGRHSAERIGIPKQAQQAQCWMGQFPKYYHMVFQRVSESGKSAPLMTLS